VAAPPVVTPAGNALAYASGRRFLAALARGDVPALMDVLDASAVLVSDGGGRVVAAINPIKGRDRIGRLLAGLIAKRQLAMAARAVTINGEPGLRLEHPDGAPYAAVTLGFTEDGARVAAVYIVRNPDKLRRREALVRGG
jgi:RNA polymerase sigma-70 factor (ECF subfamily)